MEGLELAQWALSEASRNGATAAEILIVSAESLAAGVRLGEVEKLKSSRERRLGTARLHRPIVGDRVDRRSRARIGSPTLSPSTVGARAADRLRPVVGPSRSGRFIRAIWSSSN